MPRRLPVRSGLLYAAGDAGPSLTALCLAFYWLYFLIDVAGLPTVTAGLVHGSGFVFSAAATLWAGQWLDRHVRTAASRLRLITALGAALAIAFALLWVVPPVAVPRTAWYLGMSWLFHLLFALVYLAYLSLTALIASGAQERVDLNGYRFGGTMTLCIVLLGIHASTEGAWEMEQRLSILGLAVAALVAAGSALCGVGLRPSIGNRDLGLTGPVAPWATLVRSRVLWWAVGGNLAAWFVVQMVLVLTIFLCAAAGVSDAIVLLVLQVSIVLATFVTSAAVRYVAPERVMLAGAAAWCLGAALWWGAASPMGAAVLLGSGLGAGTVLTWARMPDALDRFASEARHRVDARAYAGLTVMRDLVSAAVPVIASLALHGRAVGSPESGAAAAALLLGCSLLGGAVVTGLRLPDATRAAGAETVAVPR